MNRDSDITDRFFQDDGEPSGYDFDDIDEMDIIEARVKEAMSMERDLAAHLRRLGMEARAVILSFGESPRIRVHDCDLTFDEAAELFRRLSPEWNGQSCERSWEGLPDDNTLEQQGFPEEEPLPAKKEQEQEAREEHSEAEEEEEEEEESLPADGSPDEGPDERKKLADKRIERRRRRARLGVPKNGRPEQKKEEEKEEGEELPLPAAPPAEPPPSDEEPVLLLTPREETAAAQVLAAARSRGRNVNDPALQRRVVAASIEAMRKKKSTVAK